QLTRASAVAARPSDDPLHAWSILSGAADFAGKRRELVKQLKDRRARAADLEAKASRFVVPPSGGGGGRPPEGGTTNRSGTTNKGWFVTGQAFDGGPSTGQELLHADPQKPIQALVAPGTTHSGLVSNRLQGTLRSPTFVIAKKKMHLRIAGKEARVNLVLD